MSRAIYLDNHSTTPCDPAVIDVMLPYFGDKFGNAASRTHTFGFEAKSAVEFAREQIGALIGSSPKEVIFTSGATESNNLAILGLARKNEAKGRHIVTSAIEHKAVLDSCAYLAERGWEVTIVPVGSDGRVNPADVAKVLRRDTVVCSVMMANNEIGTVQPIAEIGAACRERDVLFHTDAAQSIGKLPVDVGALHVDLLSMSAHKMYGPKGIGALYVRRGRPRVRLEAVIHGGGHERGMRSGTLPVPLIAGMGKAAALSADDLTSGAVEALKGLRDRLWAGLQKIEGVSLNGSLQHRLPNNLNVSFSRVEAEALLMGIRSRVACSSGSACTSATLEPSYVLRATGISDELAHASIRFGVGRFNTAAEIDEAVEVITAKVAELRAMSPLYGEV